MKVPFLIATTTILILTAAPAIGQTPAQTARESQGMSNLYKQHGGQPRGRGINMRTFRHAHNRMRSHHASR